MNSLSRAPGAIRLRRRLAAPVLALAAGVLGPSGPALAQAPATGPAAGAAVTIPDPWAGANRSLYGFSMTVDKAVIAPPVHAYRKGVPEPVRKAVKNAVDNLDEPRIAGNDILQLHLAHAGEATLRFILNSTFGVAGLFDVAGESGIHRHNSDFGQTLGRWGAGTGPYVFVPFVGPSDIRDGVGRIVDAVGDPVAWVTGGLDTTAGQVREGVYVFQARVDVDDQLTGLERDFTDPYATLRSAYSQNRAFKIRQAQGLPDAAAPVDSLPDFGAEPAPAAKPAPHP